jgi:hypothetical protein
MLGVFFYLAIFYLEEEKRELLSTVMNLRASPDNKIVFERG